MVPLPFTLLFGVRVYITFLCFLSREDPLAQEPGHGAQRQDYVQFLNSSPVLTSPRGTTTLWLPQGFWF